MIANKLFPYQKEAAERIATVRSILLADQPGLGKTFTALGALEIAEDILLPATTTIITAPGTVLQIGWKPILEEHMPEVNVIDVFSGTRAARNKRLHLEWSFEKPNILLVNHDSMGISKYGKPHIAGLFELRSLINALIVDESQYVLPMDYDFQQQATQFWRGMFALQKPGFMYAKAIRLAVSGTPDRGKLHYRFGTWRFLMPHHMDPSRVLYDQWLTRHFHTYEIKVPVRMRNGDMFMKKVLKVGRLKNDEAWKQVDRTFTIRRTKKEVAPQLPDKLYIDVEIPFPEELLKKYLAFQTQFLQDDDGAKNSATVFAIRSQQFAKMDWQYSEDGKLRPIPGGISAVRDWLVDWLTKRGHVVDDEEHDGTGKVVIASQWVEPLIWLQGELAANGIRAELMTGAQSHNRRADVQEEFQHGNLRIVLLSAKLGVGIDLDAADDLVLWDIPPNPDDQEQVEDRVHRVSRNHQVMIWRPRSAGTIDMAIAAKNDAVFRKTRELLDGARGIEYERTILGRLKL